MNKTIENQYFEGEKRYEDLTITDNFMFAKVMLNEQLCKKFLELITTSWNEAMSSLFVHSICLEKDGISIPLRTDVLRNLIWFCQMRQ